LQEEIELAKKEVRLATKERDIMSKMKNASISEREEYLIVKDRKFTEIESEKLRLDNFNKERDELKEDIDKKLKERTLQ